MGLQYIGVKYVAFAYAIATVSQLQGVQGQCTFRLLSLAVAIVLSSLLDIYGGVPFWCCPSCTWSTQWQSWHDSNPG